jgi:putative transposase
VSPTRRRRALEHLQRGVRVSQRWASQLVGQHRSPQRHQPVEPDWDRALRAELRQLSWDYRQPGDGHRAARQPLLIVDDRFELLWARRDTASKDERGLHTLESCGLVP